MSKEIREGDRFLVEVEVVENDGSRYPFRVRPNGQTSDEDVWVSRSALLAAKRLPRQLRVGDRVNFAGVGMTAAKVEWTDGSRALIRYPAGALSIEDIPNLTLAEESAS